MLNIKTDSRLVCEGDTFIAIKGHTVDGHDYIDTAIKNGAKKIIAEHCTYNVETEIVDNTEKYLRQCLDSVINQTFKDIEIIVADEKPYLSGV